MNLRRHDLNLIPILHALLTHRNVTRAGAEVGLSQSATSHALMRLRDIFSDPLLVPSGRELLLSQKAEAMLDLIQVSVSALEQLFEAQVFDPATTKRHFRIATGDYVAVLFLPRLLRALGAVAPQITVEVLWDVADATAKMRAGRIDLVLLPKDAITGDGIVSESFYEDEIVLVAARDNAIWAGALDIAAVRRARLIVFRRETSVTRSFVEQQLLANDISLESALYLQDFLMIPLIVAETDHVSFLHRRFADKMKAMLPIAVRPPPFPVADFSLDGFWAANTDRDPGHVWFRGLVRDALR